MTRYLIFLAFSILLCRTAFAEVYNNPTDHFSFEIPGNWHMLSNSEIAAVPGAAGSGIVAVARNNDAAMPFCTVVVINRPAGGPSDLVNKLRQATESTGKGIVTITKSVFDERRLAVIMQGQATHPSGEIGILSYSFIGRNKIVSIVFYDPSADMSQHMSNFEQFADSFHFDLGEGYTEYRGGLGTGLNLFVGIILLAGFILGKYKRNRFYSLGPD